MEKPSLDTAKAGAMRFNTDSSQLEIYDGNQWTGVLATSPFQQTGGTRGIFHGGGDPADPTLDVMDFITITTTGNAADFGDLSSNRRNHRGNSSRIRNFAVGGYSDSAGSVRNTVEAAIFASGGGSSSFCNLTAARYVHAGGGNNVRGIHAGGHSPNAPTIAGSIDVFDTFSGTNAVDFGDLSQNRVDTAGTANKQKFVCFGGITPSKVNTIDFVTISTLGNAADFGDLTAVVSYPFGSSSSTRGVFCGIAPSVTTVCDVIEYSTLGNAKDFGDMTVSRNAAASVSDCIRIVAGGGNVPGGRTNVLDFMSFSTGGNAVDYGDLTDIRSGLAAGSNGHGGI